MGTVIILSALIAAWCEHDVKSQNDDFKRKRAIMDFFLWAVASFAMLLIKAMI